MKRVWTVTLHVSYVEAEANLHEVSFYFAEKVKKGKKEKKKHNENLFRRFGFTIQCNAM